MRRSDVHSTTRARAYFGLQATAGTVWWVLVFASDEVRRWTLGGWDPVWLAVPDLLLFVGGSAVAALAGSRFAAGGVALWSCAITTALVVHGITERAAGWGVIAMTVATTGTLCATATLWFGHVPVRWFFVGPFSFRPARERSPAAHLGRSLVQLVVFWTVFFVGVPLVVVAAERRLRIEWRDLDATPWIAIGAVGLAAGSALGLWSCVTMARHGQGTPLPAETARELVVRGPYRVVRNPMAVAGVVQTISVGLLWSSWLVVAVAVVGAFLWDAFIRPAEEADLESRFGARYEDYRSRVRCWIPTRPSPADRCSARR